MFRSVYIEPSVSSITRSACGSSCYSSSYTRRALSLSLSLSPPLCILIQVWSALDDEFWIWFHVASNLRKFLRRRSSKCKWGSERGVGQRDEA
ncbi:hypothetical protein Nepgr_014366 [Nepenthes gracilis]|uniref:Uncharacterized protein n=1 Tax=Nepenthes gracilis TaxID=150966 RepID=A0AAD3XQD9_NEPGR|nr:hypothetical protein Nepgr_014366 [Nepenthes gracilis]